MEVNRNGKILLHLTASELSQKRTMKKEDTVLTTPFPTLCGEAAVYLVQTSEGIMVLTNYRLYFQLTGLNTYYNIPLGLIEKVEVEVIVNLRITCKHARTYRFTFTMSDQCLDWLHRIEKAIAPPKCKDNVFAFAYFASAYKEQVEKVSLKYENYSDFSDEQTFKNEVDRMEFDTSCEGPWRISTVNSEYMFCNSYPRYLLVPASINDITLESASKFRKSRRVPTVVWRHRVNGAVIARCSQPEVGWLGWRSPEDEELLDAIIDACSKSKKSNDNIENKLLIFDARSYTTAVANRARGGGCECSEYYSKCEIKFLNLPNIHSVRKSFDALKTLCSMSLDEPGWYGALESTKWLHYISGLLAAAVMVVTTIERKERPVLVHCSDGWDRTPQIVSLSQLLLDPYYRTVEGFQVLVKREWLEFGHKFSDRDGLSEDGNERSPIFLQWLDTIQNLIRQFPCAFEFSTVFLVKLALHSYSNLFGTFLYNSGAERLSVEKEPRTFSIWTFLKDKKFRNHLFNSSQEVLWPECHVRYLDVWRELYLERTEKKCSIITSCKSLKFNETCNKDIINFPHVIKIKDYCGERKNDELHNTCTCTTLHENGSSHSNRNKAQHNVIAADNQDINVQINSNCPTKSDLQFISSKKQTNNVCARSNNEVSASDFKEEYNSHERFHSKPTDANVHASSACSKLDIVENEFIETANKSGGSLFTQIQSVLPLLDLTDGLAPLEDQVQIRLQEIALEHESEVLALEKELDTTRTDLLQQPCCRCSQNKCISEADAVTEHSQDDDSSNTDGSWVAVEDRTLNLWVPDEAISHCMNCNSEFWFGCRKHHCRKCGNIFCANCSKFTVALPEDHLNQPVRVCESCYITIALERSENVGARNDSSRSDTKILSNISQN